MGSSAKASTRAAQARSAPPGSEDADQPAASDASAGAVAAPPRRGFGTAALALCIVVGLVLGYALGWLTPRLTAPGEDSAEAGFARDMMTHHAQAVEMSLISYRDSADEVVKQLAVDVLTAQQGEIGMMYAWLDEWGVNPTGSQPAMAWMPESMRQLDGDGLMPGMADAEEMRRLRATTGREQDILFLQLMIRHHLGGVHMIDAILEAGDDPTVIEAAETMRDVQEREMTNLQASLRRLGGTPLPAD